MMQYPAKSAKPGADGEGKQNPQAFWPVELLPDSGGGGAAAADAKAAAAPTATTKPPSQSIGDAEDTAALFADLDRNLDMLKLDNAGSDAAVPRSSSAAAAAAAAEEGSAAGAPNPNLGGVHWTPLLDLGSGWD